jgi:O-antigen/teichoic acid export membrane protein
VILGAILFEPDPLLRVGLAVTAATFFVASVRDFVGGVNWAYQRYGIIARVTLLIAILSPVFMLGTVSRLGVFSMILAPLVVAMASLGAYLIFAPSIRFRWSWDWAEARRLFKIGFPMALLGFFYWAFRSVGRTVIATGRGFEELGYFVFAMNFVNLAIQIFSDFGNVVQPTLWTEMGRTGNVRKLAHDVVDNVIAIMLVACLAVSLGQAAYGPFVSIFLPKFAGSVPLFDVLILTVPLVAASIIPSILLNSAELNRQGMNAGIWAGALVVNAGLSFVAFRYLDWGTLGVAWVAVVMQAATTAVLYGVTHRYVFDSLRNELPLYGAVVGMFAVDLVLLAAMPLSGPFASHGGALIAGAVRIVLVLVAWVPVAAAVWWARAMRRRVTI